MYGEQRWRRTWFPDEQVAPDEVIEVLRNRRSLAGVRAGVRPWMSAVDIGLFLGLMKDGRWKPPGVDLEEVLKPDPTRCYRSAPRGVRWRHPVAQRDVSAALRHYEAHGQVLRLPHPLATWAVYVAPLDHEDGRRMFEALAEMDRAREQARHEQRMYRLAAGRRAGCP